MCSYHTSSKELPFAMNTNHDRDLQLIIMQKISNHGAPSPSWYIYNTIPTPKDQETLRRGYKDCKNQRTKLLALIEGKYMVKIYLNLNFLNNRKHNKIACSGIMSSRQNRDAAPMKSQQHDYLCKNCTMTTSACNTT